MVQDDAETEYVYTHEEIVALCREAERLKLQGESKLSFYSPAELQAIGNGIGAEWMPGFMRSLLTALSPFAEAPALIHDVEYFEGGDEAARSAADRRFRENIITTAKACYRWYHPLRYLAMARAGCFYALLRIFGAAAWSEEGDDCVEHQ